MTVSISSVLIAVRDLTKARAFYEQVFGFSFQEFRPPFASAVLDGIEFNIEENDSSRETEWTEKYLGKRNNMSFEVNDLNKFITRATKNNARIIREPEEKPWGWMEAVISDPDGNEFLIEQKI